MFCDRDEKMIVENTRAVRWSVAAHEDAQERTETTPLWNEAQLNCVSLRSQLDCEVTCGPVKGHDERPLRGALDNPASHHRGSMPTSENKLLNTRKTDKTGGAVGRPICQSSFLSDPNAKVSVEMSRRPQRTKNVRRAATSALTFMTFS